MTAIPPPRLMNRESIECPQCRGFGVITDSLDYPCLKEQVVCPGCRGVGRFYYYVEGNPMQDTVDYLNEMQRVRLALESEVKRSYILRFVWWLSGLSARLSQRLGRR